MGIFKGIKDLVWEKDPKKDKPIVDDPQPVPQPENKPAYKYVDYSSQSNNNTSPVTSNSGRSTDIDLTNARKHFDDLLAKNNQPGNDYYEFTMAKNAMDELPNEEKRYTIAYKGFSAAGLTKETILSSANFYLSVIEKDLQNFQSSFDLKFKVDVTDNKAKIAQKAQMMKNLNDQIAALNNDINELQNTVSENELKLNSTKNAFISAGGEAKNIITTEIQKINQYIIN